MRPAAFRRNGVRLIRCGPGMPGPYRAANFLKCNKGKAHGRDESLPYGAKKLPALSAGSAGVLTLAYTRVFKTSCSGTGASMGRGAPSTHWMAFFGHLETQVPQPLHLV